MEARRDGMTDYSARAHFNNYDPSSFGWPHAVPDLVPLSFDGVNFGQCARQAHGLFVALLTELVPHIQGGLHAGSCWCYSTTDDLPDGSWSFHRYGIAIDVNWNVNHMGTNIPDAHGKYAIPRGIATALARKYGCEWGGNWSGGFHDNMHFEVHLTPDVARTVTPAKPPKPITTATKYPYRSRPLDYIGDINGDKHSHGGVTTTERAQVRFVFSRLAHYGYWHGAVPSVFSGAAMSTAVKRFKQRNGFHGDAKVGWWVWNRLCSNDAKAATK